MRSRFVRSLFASALVVAAVGVTTVAASADPGPGTFTRITSPKTMIYKYDELHPAANSFIVSGVTSSDVTSVDIDCLWNSPSSGLETFTFATSVPVTSGSFSTTAQFPQLTSNCRLRAIPSGEDTADYLGSYSGPILYANAFEASSASGVAYGFIAIGEQGDGVAVAADAGTCGAVVLATVQTPSMTALGLTDEQCGFALTPTNIATGATSTASAITVDGHNAYLPAGVHGYLIGSQSLAVAQPKLTTTFARAKNGDLTITESAPLMRCSVSNTFPPTTLSCPKLVSTGVTFKRTDNLFRGDHQIRIRDTFTSSGASHSVTLQYVGSVPQPATGSPGFVLPGHGSAYVTPKAAVSYTGLGRKAASMVIRSDRFAGSDEVEADTHSLTWSAAPSKLVFAKPATTFGLDYSLTVPKHGTAFLGFADSENPTNAGVAKLSALAVGDVMTSPTISSPKAGTSITGRTTHVSGSVTAGANGLPTSVSVNGHKAALTVSSETRARWTVTFSESFARHKITVTATDRAGNTSTRSIKVTNKH